MLRKVVEQVRDNYDYVLIDCSPSLGLITVNSLTAADSVIIPVQCEYFALEGLGKLLNTIRIIQNRLNTKLVIEGFLLTMYDERTNLSKQVAAELRESLGSTVFEVMIPRNVTIAEAPSFGKPVGLYAPKSKGAQAYFQLAREFLNYE